MPVENEVEWDKNKSGMNIFMYTVSNSLWKKFWTEILKPKLNSMKWDVQAISLYVGIYTVEI